MRPETEKRPTARFRAAAPSRLGPWPSSRRPGRRNGPRAPSAWASISPFAGRQMQTVGSDPMAARPSRRIKTDVGDGAPKP